MRVTLGLLLIRQWVSLCTTIKGLSDMTEYKFYTTDVFTDKLFGGAQIAVIPEADGLTEQQMLLLAREFNLSETVFAFASKDADYDFKLRIYDTHGEVKFGSHTLIASCFVLAKTGQIALDESRTGCKLLLGNKIYEASIDADNGVPYFVQFATAVSPKIDVYVPRAAELADILSIDQQEIGLAKYRTLLSVTDTNYLVVPVKNYAAVRKAVFDIKAWGRSSAPAMLIRRILLFSNQAASKSADFHARLMGPDIGIDQDLPIGAAIPAFTAYLCEHAHLPRGTHAYVAERGMPESRLSLLSVEMDHKREQEITMRVGGPAVLVSSGVINVE